MKHFVYIIYSELFDKYYKGYTTDPYKRLLQHNQGESRYTKHYIPWELVFIESFEYKREALIREKSLKKYSKIQIRQLIKSDINLLNTNNPS